jgi:hypothetical protein
MGTARAFPGLVAGVFALSATLAGGGAARAAGTGAPPRAQAPSPAVTGSLGPFALSPTPSSAATGAPDAGSSLRPLDAREVMVPIAGAERIRIDNPLGNVTVRAWGRPGMLHVSAEKRAATQDALGRLRVHYTAWANGEISLETRVELGGRERALPLSGSRIDLVVEVPPDLEVEAKTFAGDLSASGLRAGARLETTGGAIGVSDVRGRVITRQMRGGQRVAEVEGEVDLDGVEGHMHLERLTGSRVEARMVDGDIHAEDVRSDDVRLSATTGTVLLVGVLRPRTRYDLRSYEGDVRVEVTGAPQGFELRARSPLPVESSLPMEVLWKKGERLHAASRQAAAARSVAARGGRGATDDRPVLELTSVLGRVVLHAVSVEERP